MEETSSEELIDKVGHYEVSFTLLAISVFVAYVSVKWLLGCVCSGNNFQRTEDTKNKAVLITGCDSGFGLAMARHFIENTKLSVVCTFLNPRPGDTANDTAGQQQPATSQPTIASNGYELLRKLSHERQDGSRIHLLKLNLRSDESIDSVVKYIDNCIYEDKVFTNLWALINNAGILFFAEFDWYTAGQIDATLNVNVVGPMKLTKKLLPHIIEARGRIINVSSVGDITVYPGLSVYTATKAAVTMFSHNLRMELEKFNCHVILFRPGLFPGSTRILDNHNQTIDSMWSAMSEKQRKIYGKMNEWTKNIIEKERTAGTKRKIKPPKDTVLTRDIDRAVMSKSPPNEIICSSFWFKVVFFFNGFVPIVVQTFISRHVFKIVFGKNPVDLINNQYVQELQSKSSQSASS